MGWILCGVLILTVLVYIREIIDIGVIILCLIALERFNTLIGGVGWAECVILGVCLSPVIIYFLREAYDS